jgi:thiamine biosynthesis lipoprotein ApbE
VTVIASRGIIADALTKVVRLAPRRAKKILSHFGAQALVIDRRGVRFFQTEESEVKSALFGGMSPSRLHPETTHRLERL